MQSYAFVKGVVMQTVLVSLFFYIRAIVSFMKLRLLYMLLFLFVSVSVQAQTLKTVSYYLQHRGVSEDAIEFYTGRLTVKDIDKALDVADSMFTRNDETRPFYMLLVSRMLGQAKGELRQQLNVTCRHFVEQHPSELVAFLFQKHHLVSSSFIDRWAYRVSVDIRVMCNEDLLSCLKQSRNIALSNCDEKYKAKIEVLYNNVRKQLNLFQQR